MRASLTLLVCLGWVSLGMAGEEILIWEYDVTLQPQVKYLLRMISLQQGRPTQEERWLTPLPRGECRYLGVPDTPETQCARTCFAPADYSLTLSAVRDIERSPESLPVLDAALTATSPCTGGPPSGQVRVPPSLVVPGVTVGAGAAAYAALQAREATTLALPQLLNLGCVQATQAPCVCGFPPQPCLHVTYWEPRWLVETTIRPGETMLPAPFDALLSGALAAAGLAHRGAGGAANATGAGQTNKHFGEVHVFTLPNLLGGPCTACLPSGVPLLNYASELDVAGWRIGPPPLPPVAALARVGFWGTLFPRVGHVIHGSPVVASGLMAARAMSIAVLPASPPPLLDVHLVPTPTVGTSTCCQLASPRQTPCFTFGTPPFLFEQAAVSVKGRYLWVLWHRQTCCVPPPLAVCGIVVPGVGLHGDNDCVLPQ